MIDVLTLIQNLENAALVSGAFTFFTNQFDIGQELHLHSHGSIALAYLATAAWNVEREASGVVTARLCLACGGEDIADVIERLDIGYGIRSRRAPDGTLIDQNNIANPLDSAFDKSRSGSRIACVQCRFNGLVQAFVNQSRFAGTRYSCDARH